MKGNHKVNVLVLSVILSALLSACGELKIEEGVQINIESSSLYTKSEIQSAIDICVDYFNANFEGCVLTEISYNDEFCIKEKDKWAVQYEADEAIVLTSTFVVDENGGDGSFNPNDTYTDWQWILTRSNSDGAEWVLQTWGY